jgi:hypothetical protein
MLAIEAKNEEIDDLSLIVDSKDAKLSKFSLLNNEQQRLDHSNQLRFLDPTFWHGDDIDAVERYIQWHHEHPRCTTPRLKNEDDFSRRGMLIDDTRTFDPNHDLVYYPMLDKASTLPQEFQPVQLGANCRTNDVALIAADFVWKRDHHKTGHEEDDYFPRQHKNPWMGLSVQDQLIMYHDRGNSSIAKLTKANFGDRSLEDIVEVITTDPDGDISIQKQASSTVSEPPINLPKWALTPFSGYNGGSPWVQNGVTNLLSSLSIEDRHTNQRTKNTRTQDISFDISPKNAFAQNRFLANGKALNAYQRYFRNQLIRQALELHEQEQNRGPRFNKSPRRLTIKASSKRVAQGSTRSGIGSWKDVLSSMSQLITRSSRSNSVHPSNDDKKSLSSSSNYLSNIAESLKSMKFSSKHKHDHDTDDEEEDNDNQDRTATADDKKTVSFTAMANKPSVESTSKYSSISSMKYTGYTNKAVNDIVEHIGGDQAVEKIARSFVKYSHRMQSHTIADQQHSTIFAAKSKDQNPYSSLFEACDGLHVNKVRSYLLTHGLLATLLFDGELPPLYYMFEKGLKMDVASGAIAAEEVHGRDIELFDELIPYQQINLKPTSDQRGKVNQILQIFLDYRTPIDLITFSTGYAVIHLAAVHGNNEMIKWCLKKGSNIHLPAASMHKNMTPILLAAKYQHIRTIVTLYNYGGDLKDVDKDGNTALHYGASSGSFAMVIFLLRIGLPKNRLNKQGQSPSDVAHEMKHPSLAQLILSYRLPEVPKLDILDFQVEKFEQGVSTSKPRKVSSAIAMPPSHMHKQPKSLTKRPAVIVPAIAEPIDIAHVVHDADLHQDYDDHKEERKGKSLEKKKR